MSKLRFKLYSSAMRSIFQGLLLPRLAPRSRLEKGRQQWAALGNIPERGRATRIWWHASSVGELEILWPVIQKAASNAVALSQNQGAQELILTVLSESAEERLRKLTESLSGTSARIVFSGFSPWEGDWGSALEQLQPTQFVTAKYEAWPELWGELARLGIPLSIVSAKNRRSLSVCKKACSALGVALPSMQLLSVTEKDAAELAVTFPQAQVKKVGEARWDQVWHRVQKGNPRAKEIVQAISRLPRPWGVLGSSWQEDLALWIPVVQATRESGKGTFLIVPHKVDEAHLKLQMDLLKEAQIPFVRTSEIRSFSDDVFRGVNCILVDEMGFLSELYAAADWAYVGGGIGKRGVHSTIEPAIHGIPICCGTYRAHQFVEIDELSKNGQLTLVKDQSDVSRWYSAFSESVKSGRAVTDRRHWADQAMLRLGATERILETLFQVKPGSVKIHGSEREIFG